MDVFELLFFFLWRGLGWGVLGFLIVFGGV